jgi:hypothetical protein
MENNTEGSRRIFKVPAENIELLRSQVEVVNRRVDRLRKAGHDVARVEIKVGAARVEKTEKRTGAGTVVVTERVYSDVELLSPQPPRIDGWTLVAALTHVEGVGTVLRVCPGVPVTEGELKRYRDASPDNCDHCHTSRRRSDTFVVRDREGELSQVGRQCLQAYTGLADPLALCSTAEILFSLSQLLSDSEDDEFGGGCATERYVTIAHFLPYVACSIRESGWLSRSDATAQGCRSASTCDMAFSHGVYATPQTRDRYVPAEKDYNLASAAIEFCESYFTERDVDGLTDYESSLRVAMASGIAHPKFAGLVASSIQFYKRDLERRACRESWQKMVECSRFQGTVGERRVFEGLKVLSHHERGSDFGVTHIYSMVDEAGNAFVYFASRDMGLEVGQVVALNATVKKHETRVPRLKDGTTGAAYAQTVITRCSLVARVRMVSAEVREVPGRVVLANPGDLERQLKLGDQAGNPRPMVKQYVYHLEGLDGRKFGFFTNSRKKALVVGCAAFVSYDAGAEAGAECPVSLVSVG